MIDGKSYVLKIIKA